MADHSALSIGTDRGSIVSLNFTDKERNILRKLAGGVAELAARPVEDEKRKLWYKHNALENVRPVVICDPENGWEEIVLEENLECQSELARKWETLLRKEIFWGQSMGDDRVTEPYFNIPYILYRETDWGMHETKIGGANHGAYRWDAPLKDYSDLDKLKFPEIIVDYESTEKIRLLAEEIFGDLLNVCIKGIWWWTLGMTMTLVHLRGLEQMMYDVYDYPDELHRLMAFLRDGHLKKLDFLEENGLLSLNNDGTYVGSGGFGYSNELPQKEYNGNVRTIDMWGFSESQETTTLSKEMFKEFVYPYQLPILERFGLNCYGCCEPLDKRWDVISSIPRLRRVSVSPWANWKVMAEILQDKYIFSMKPSPSDLATKNIDIEYIRKNLREALKFTKGCRVEIIMKDNNTIGKNSQNVVDWCRIAREEAESV